MPGPIKLRDYDDDKNITWHDFYLADLSVVEKVSVQLGNWLFTPISALLHTVWFVTWFALGLDINLLTLIVSLEAIYITLFIGLGQKLQDKRSAIEAKADKKVEQRAEKHREDLAESQEKLLDENTKITKDIEKLTEQIHKHLGISGS
jgi:uncharacterized membrane protein